MGKTLPTFNPSVVPNIAPVIEFKDLQSHLKVDKRVRSFNIMQKIENEIYKDNTVIKSRTNNLINLVTPFRHGKPHSCTRSPDWRSRSPEREKAKSLLTDPFSYREHIMEVNSKPLVKDYIREIGKMDANYKKIRKNMKLTNNSTTPSNDQEPKSRPESMINSASVTIVTDPSHSRFLQ
jgi:hypothetical protein